ncbi:thiol reductant ABC exporter subunit CydD [Pectinatus sottacetonis]|uniref:thiol reductant ABC exporter subunit CydD n=1 Tax=Pectinatus sottacetonis TaxID=1002795 RepID=UPI0018C46FBC|nr:thiol reductant ABC exporter subunit CydD [Pectinatus sottacetonis]
MIDKNLLKELQPYKGKIYNIIVLDIIGAATIIGRCYSLAYIINRMLFSRLDLKTAEPYLALLFFCFMMEAVLNLWVRFITHGISVDIRKKLRFKIIDKLAEFDFMSQVYKMDILQTASTGIDSFDAYFSRFLPQLLVTVLVPLFIIPTAFYNDWISGLIFLVTLPLIPFFMMLIGKKAQLENKKQWSALTQLSAVFMELLSGIAVIKMYNQAENQLKKIVKTGSEFSQAVLKVLRIAFLSAFFLELTATLSIAIIAVNIGLRLLYGQAHFLPVFFILLMAPEFYKALRQTGSMFHDAMGALTNADKIYAIVNASVEIGLGHKIPCIPKPPEIVLEKIDFQYDAAREKALCDVNITFAAGKITSLVGNSGAGKSTIFSLLLKFIAPCSGSILVDGINLDSLESVAWRKNIAYVPQQAHIFSASVRENICMGKNYSDSAVKNAIKEAGMTDFVKNLSAGINTIIGNGGIGLSYGQARRIALARVFMSDASILLLDEPMEGLDLATEEVVQRGINILAEHKTVIIIAHRLESIKNSDQIYVLSQGQIIESGSHENLLKQKGLYYKMMESTEAF